VQNPVETLPDVETAWRQLLARDRTARFVYAVTTTGVFCRPGCASRAPLRKNVRFFATATQAQTAGFRPCLRCKPMAAPANPLAQVRAFLEANLDRRVSLEELGHVADLSPFTVQRLFKQEMGASPLAYQRALRASRLRTALRKESNVTNAIYEAGFNSSSRAYAASSLGMTPSRFAQGGRGERIGFATAKTAFGWMIVGATTRGICWLALAGSQADAEASLRTEFPAADLHADSALKPWLAAAAAAVEGDTQAATDLHLDLRGTAFQLRIWSALQQIPRGETRTYSQLARDLGMPRSTRAVARACALNRVSVLVPCHRVVGASGSLTGYRWGVERKRALLAAEQSSHTGQ
jgi:AraC family transcriptional regulator of adaptative response/methylated-DNA-[protein]-cysteine methyltransferase